MVDQNSLGSLGPNVISIEPVTDIEYSVQGHNFVTGFHVQVSNGVGQEIQGATVSQATATALRLKSSVYDARFLHAGGDQP